MMDKYYIFVLILLHSSYTIGSNESCEKDSCDNENTIEKVDEYIHPPHVRELLEKLNITSELEVLAQNPTYTDWWGVVYNWTSIDAGWYPMKKQYYLRQIELLKFQTKAIRRFTEIGYKVMKIPPVLYETILNQRNMQSLQKEDCEGLWCINCEQYIDGKLTHMNNTFLMDFMNPKVVVRAIKYQLLKIMENWANVKLDENGNIYGIRRYTRGAILLQHVDKIPNHIISAILQIDQKVDEDWPLTVIDHKGNKVEVFLKPGEMVLYEGGTVPHGRQFPFNGEYFDNLFALYTIKEGDLFL